MNGHISLRWRIILPLLMMAVAGAVLAALAWQSAYTDALQAQLESRADMYAVAVHYAATSGDRDAALQAFVARLGAERDVEAIVVAADSPPRVVAATRFSMQNMPLAGLPPAERAELSAGLKETAAKRYSADDSVHLLMPFRRVFSGNGAMKIERMAVLVQVRERHVAGWKQSLSRISGALLAGTLAFVVLVGYLLISRLVIRPLHELEMVALAFGRGDRNRRAAAGRRNEVGRLTGSFNELLDTIQRGEGRLRESEERLRAIINNSPTVIFLKDREGRYLLVNNRYEELFGVSNAAIRGKTDYDIFPRDKADAFCANDRVILAGGRAQQFEEIVPHADGLHTYISVKFPLHDAAGLACAVCGIATDITERKRLETVVSGSEEKYRRLVETTETGYLILDAAGKVVDANAEYVRLSGHGELGEILGRSVVEWTAPHEREKNAAAVEKCVRDRKTRGLEVEYVDGAGKITPVVINASVEGEGDALRIIALVSDISERRRAEVQAKRQFDELKRWHNVILNREERIAELKREVARLRAQLAARPPAVDDRGR